MMEGSQFPIRIGEAQKLMDADPQHFILGVKKNGKGVSMLYFLSLLP
jgi:hypothetical protein